MVRRLWAIAVMGVFAMAGVAYAEGSPFEMLDTNHDGVLSEAEAAKAGIDFSKADANKDGKLDKKEFDAAVG
jgi:hypothetical protein